MSRTVFDLLTFADEADRELYFDPDFEVELMDYVEVDDEDKQTREYRLLAATDYTLSEALTQAREGSVDENPLTKSEFKIPDSTVRDYLETMADGEIADAIHDHPTASRSVIVGLAEAGYTAPEDLISETEDHIDIAKNAGLDRGVVSAIAQEFVSGFVTGSELQNQPSPLADVSLADSFDGWGLSDREPTDTHAQWVSHGRFNLTVKTLDGTTSLVLNTPQESKHSYYRKGRKVLLDSADIEIGKAVEEAHDWLESNQLPTPEETGLTEFDGIGPSTHDYLVLEYGVTSPADLQQFLDENREEAEQVFDDQDLATLVDTVA